MQSSGHLKFRLTRFYHQIANLFCCTNTINSPVFGCSANNLSGPLGANSSTGNLLEPTSLTNVNTNAANSNTIYGQHHHRRFLPRLPNGSGRSNHHHPYGAMFYSEFEYRPPPPSYAQSQQSMQYQSMQEYRLRMMLYDVNSNAISTTASTSNGNVTAGPAPVVTSTAVTNNTATNTSSTNNSSNNNSSAQTSASTSAGTFSGLLSNLGSFVSNSFSGSQQQNTRTLSPPPIYRAGSTLAGKKRLKFSIESQIDSVINDY